MYSALPHRQVSQCIDSRVDLTAYALGRSLSDIGVISGADMTTECVAAKIAYLLGKVDLSLQGTLARARGAAPGRCRMALVAVGCWCCARLRALAPSPPILQMSST